MELFLVKNKIKELCPKGKLSSVKIRHPSFVISQYYQYILENTRFLDYKNPKFSERIYCIENDIKELPKCSICGKSRRFVVYSLGYSFCNNQKCVNKLVPHKSCGPTKKQNNIETFLNFRNSFLTNNYKLLDRNDCLNFIKERLEKTNNGRIHQLVDIGHIKNNFEILYSIIFYTKELYPLLQNDFNWSERFYVLLNDLKDFPKCVICGKNSSYISVADGFRMTCSSECGQIHGANRRALSHFKNHVKPIILKQDFEILNEENYQGLNLHPIKLKCKKCGEHLEKDLSDGQYKNIYCYGCYGRTGQSQEEQTVMDYIKAVYDGKILDHHTIQKYKNGKKEADIYVPDKNLAIEYNGIYWHSRKEDKEKHLKKTDICKELGIKLLHIFSNEWDDYRQIIWKSIIKKNLDLGEPISAKDCYIKEVGYEEKNDFLLNNHLEGVDNSELRIGLYFEEELVTLMTFSKKLDNNWEIVRYCEKNDINVIGGFEKLLNNLEIMQNPSSVMIKVDRRYEFGNDYLKIGFVLDSVIDPRVFYVKGSKLVMENDGKKKYKRIWDCGSYVFAKNYK